VTIIFSCVVFETKVVILLRFLLRAVQWAGDGGLEKRSGIVTIKHRAGSKYAMSEYECFDQRKN